MPGLAPIRATVDVDVRLPAAEAEQVMRLIVVRAVAQKMVPSAVPTAGSAVRPGQRMLDGRLAGPGGRAGACPEALLDGDPGSLGGGH